MTNANGNMTTVRRQHLYELVWQTPASKLATEFGISTFELASLCKLHQIPRPSRGYWVQLAFGKNVGKAALPEAADDSLEEVAIFRRQFFSDAGQGEGGDSGASTAIVVPEKLNDPHPLIEQSRRYLSTTKSGNDKLLPPGGASCLQVRVSSKVLDRALRILDAFIKHWESIGGTVSIADGSGNGKLTTRFQLPGNEVPVELHEEVDRISTQTSDVCRNWKFRNCRQEPTGRLIFSMLTCADSQRTRWADGKRQNLELILGDVTKGLISILNTERLRRMDAEYQARQRAAVRVVREAATKRQEISEARRDQLLDDLNSWKLAVEIRLHLAAIDAKRRAGELRVVDPRAFSAWSDWATWYADSIDPLVATPPRPECVPMPKNTSVSQLDLSGKTRALVMKLEVSDAIQLFDVEHADVNSHVAIGATRNGITFAGCWRL